MKPELVRGDPPKEGEAQRKYLVGNFAFKFPMPGQDGAELQLSGEILSGETAGEISRKIDVLYDVADRQKKRAAIGMLKSQVKAHTEQIQSQRDIFKEQSDKQAAGEKLSHQQKLNLQNSQKSIDKTVEHIKKLEAAIKDLEESVAL